MIQTNGVKIKVSIDFLLSVIITVPPFLFFGFSHEFTRILIFGSGNETEGERHYDNLDGLISELTSYSRGNFKRNSCFDEVHEILYSLIIHVRRQRSC